jgi:type IV secretory pathway VirB2 component (pilin)
MALPVLPGAWSSSRAYSRPLVAAHNLPNMSQGKESNSTLDRREPPRPRLIRFWLSCAGRQRFLLFTLAAAALCLCDPSYAQSFGKINTALQTLVDFMTGTTGRLLGILGVAGLGVAAWFGRLSYWRAGEIVLGIAIVFGAAQIVDLFAR